MVEGVSDLFYDWDKLSWTRAGSFRAGDQRVARIGWGFMRGAAALTVLVVAPKP